MTKLLILVAVCGACATAEAGQLAVSQQGARGTAQAEALTADVTDSSAVTYNPAARSLRACDSKSRRYRVLQVLQVLQVLPVRVLAVRVLAVRVLAVRVLPVRGATGAGATGPGC